MQLTNDQIKSFAIQLSTAESEEEVIQLLTRYEFWNDSSCWRYFGDLENNYSSIGNQQASSDAALVEKIINSIDATIMGDLLSKGIDPKSDRAPRSIPEYLKDYKRIPEGKLSLLDSATRQKMSEDILLVSTSNTTSKNPNYCIIDSGEGQTANSLPRTILSLQASNKLKVGAVQGKFNMGGTGVMMFSGTEKFQVIITRKRQDIPATLRGNDDSFDHWAVTIVRREEPTGLMKSSCFKYLAPQGKVLSFSADSLPLKPSYSSTDAIPYKAEMEYGTFIKVFDYHIRGYNSVSTIHLHDRLSLLIPGIALPVKIVECRKTKAKRSKTLYGLMNRLEENKRDALECEPIGIKGSLHGEPLQASFYIFKKGYGESFKRNEAILYVLNGQCQGVETKKFFEKLKLSYLADSILMVLDCSQLSSKMCEELFLNSRDRLKKGKTRDDILKFIEDEVKGLPILKELNAKRRSEELSDQLDQSKMVSNIVGDVLTKSKILNNLLLQGKDLTAPKETQTPDGKEVELPLTQEFPSFFTLKKKNRKTAEIGRKIKIELDTDASNDYFIRDKLPGSYVLDCSVGVLTDYSLKVINGVGYLTIDIDPHLFKVGDYTLFRLMITDETRVSPIVVEFGLEIVEKTPDSPSGDKKPTKSRQKQEKALPPIKEVRKEEWIDLGMNEFSAIVIKESEQDGVYDFYCNLDNKYLRIERQNPKSNIPYLESIFSTGLIVASMSVISHYQRMDHQLETDDSDWDLKELVKDVSASLAPTIIPIITELSKVKEFEEK